MSCVIGSADAVMFDLLSFQFDQADTDTTYIGAWEGDVRSGPGMEESAVGSYQGDFAEGERSG